MLAAIKQQHQIAGRNATSRISCLQRAAEQLGILRLLQRRHTEVRSCDGLVGHLNVEDDADVVAADLALGVLQEGGILDEGRDTSLLIVVATKY